MVKYRFIVWFCFLFLGVNAQNPVKVNYQVWASVNTSFLLNNSWSVLADLHIRRTDFIADPSFYFLRGGMQYRINSKLSVAAGYAHNWVANKTAEGYLYTQENRLWQQLLISDKFAGTNFLFRLRNEQRKSEIFAKDSITNQYLKVNRIRILNNFLIPIFGEESKTKLLLADEFLFNLGNPTPKNTFDQNRLTIGIRRQINAAWSYDLGYMMVYQQLSDGINHNLNHTLRLFFYGNIGVKQKSDFKQNLHAGEE